MLLSDTPFYTRLNAKAGFHRFVEEQQVQVRLTGTNRNVQNFDHCTGGLERPRKLLRTKNGSWRRERESLNAIRETPMNTDLFCLNLAKPAT